METRFNNPIFVCGESLASAGEAPMSSTKAVLLANLAPNWAVRTHHEADGTDPRADKETLFRNIASSYVFLFIFSEETSMNAFYLNQLGISLARGVPVVGVREPSYIMPNPLPEHFYSTEVVDLTEGRRSDGRGRPSGQRGKAILANLLIELFRGAVVYTVDFHKPCLERLFRKVTDAFARSAKERCFPPGFTDHGRTPGKGAETAGQKVWTSVGGLAKCPKCGSPVKTQRKTSVLRKTNSVDNLLKKETALRATSRQQRRDAPHLVITKSVLQPVLPLQSSFSKIVFHPGPRRPATSVVRQTASSKSAGSAETRVDDPRDNRGSRPTSSKSCNAISDNSPPIKEVKRAGMKRDDERESVAKETSNVEENEGTFVRRKKSSTTGFITNRRGAFLRKMSSLPCIPTTYLVTDPASDAPAFVKYPPVSDDLSGDDANVPEFTDDEDKETIHISRRPSPAISTCSTNIE